MGTADAGQSLIALIASKAIRSVTAELISLAGVLPPDYWSLVYFFW